MKYWLIYVTLLVCGWALEKLRQEMKPPKEKRYFKDCHLI